MIDVADCANVDMGLVTLELGIAADASQQQRARLAQLGIAGDDACIE
jgi:hypothetical protein